MLFIKAMFYLGNPETNSFWSGRNWGESTIFLVDEMLKVLFETENCFVLTITGINDSTTWKRKIIDTFSVSKTFVYNFSFSCGAVINACDC